MGGRIKLKKRKIEHDPDGPSKQIVRDDRLPNFGVRLNPGGSKAFVVSYRNKDHRKRLVTIGCFGRMTVKQARLEALQTVKRRTNER